MVAPTPLYLESIFATEFDILVKKKRKKLAKKEGTLYHQLYQKGTIKILPIKRPVENPLAINCNFPRSGALALPSLEANNVFLEVLHLILKSDCITISGVIRLK